MPPITLEAIEAKQTELAEMIQRLHQQASNAAFVRVTELARGAA